jgi:hypothetical protein
MSSYQRSELDKAASHSCAMQKAYAIMVGISYDLAAELLHEEALAKEVSEDTA